MRRLFYPGLLLALAAGLSCVDSRLPTAPTGASIGMPAFNEETTCTPKSYTDLQAAVNTAFGEGSPNAQSALGKLDNIKKFLDRGDVATARQKTLDLVDFILVKNAENPLPGGEAAVIELVNSLFCFVGLSDTISDPDNSWIVDPLDPEQTFITEDGKAGLKVSGDNVDDLTLIQITPGAASDKLNTKLDEHGPIYHFQKSGSNSFRSPVIVAICPTPGLDDDTFAHLVVGHGGEGEDPFELLEEEDGTWLPCEETAPASFSRTAASATVVSANVTTLQTRGGGVAGATGTFSHFGVVDSRACTSTSCATGTFNIIDGAVITFDRVASFNVTPTSACPTSYLAGSDVPAGCRPSITISTPLGTPLGSVPVTFAVTAGGGTVGLVGEPCTSFATSKVVNTSTTGTSTVCWRIGSVGTNTVVATPGFGGDAPVGTTFVPAFETFTVQAVPLIEFTAGQQTNFYVDQTVNPSCTYNGTGGNPCIPSIAGFPSLALLWGLTNTVTPVSGSSSFTFYVRATYTTLCNVSKNGAVVTDPKLGEALCAKLSSASASEAKGDTRGKVKALDTYIAQVNTQMGKQIITSFADDLIRWAEYCKLTACISASFPSASLMQPLSFGSAGVQAAPAGTRSGPAIRR